jgi:hypothetical protein
MTAYNYYTREMDRIAVRPGDVARPYRVKVSNAFGESTKWLSVTPDVFDALRVALDATPGETEES